MKTLNDLAYASLAVLGRERMESTKRRSSLAWLIVALLTGVLSQGFAGPATSALPAQGEAALAQLKERGLYDSLQEALAAARYGVYPEQPHRATWQAENPAQQLRARFTAEGVQVQVKPGHGDPQRIGMKLRSVGYGERLVGVSAARLTSSGSRIEYRRSLVGNDGAAGAVTEWYVNTAAGLEQGFTLDSAPGERRDGEPLRVVLALEGELAAQAVDGGQALEFKDAAGQPVLRYDHLVVSDAGGRKLEARMAVRMEGTEAQALLEVDDRDALWPVTIDPTFTQQQKLVASDAAGGDLLGSSVAISGETVVVGAPDDDDAAGSRQGSAYVFVRSGGVWSQQQKLLASDGAEEDRFGTSVAISGETVVVGAPDDDDAMGSRQGSAYVFVRSSVSWSQQQKLLASDATGGQQFGTSVAISGETVVVGAVSGQGSAYVFARSGGVWSQQQKLVALDAAAGDRFGESVAISSEGSIPAVAVGAPRDDFAAGSAYVFARDGGSWIQEAKLVASDPAADDLFGTSVAISGETVVVGAWNDDGAASANQGSAYVFVSSGLAWIQQAKLEASDAAAGDIFGGSVAISGETIVVGASFDDGDEGSAYVFARSGGVWSQQQKLEASDAAAGDQFGRSVAISGETIVVGARRDDGAAGADQGSAYVFVADTPPADDPPMITLKDPISLWPPNHKYRAVTMSQMVQSASDAEDGNLTNSVVIEKVTSDEPDNAPGGGDGNTSNDIVIAGYCKSVQLRSERDETKNGRVYSVTLRVADSVGNVTRAVFKVSVPLNQSGAPAVDSGPALTVTSACQ